MSVIRRIGMASQKGKRAKRRAARKRQLIWASVLAVLVATWGVVYLISISTGGPAGALASGTSKERLAAITQLLNVGTHGSAAVLAEYCLDEDEQIAVRCTDALGRLAFLEHEATLAKVLKDRRPNIRAAAVVAIGRYGRKEADHQLVMASFRQDKMPQVRAAAAKVFGRNLLWDAMPDLVNGLRDDSVEVRTHSFESVSKILGVRFKYYPSASPESREPVVKTIEKYYSGFEKQHASYIERLEETGQ